MSNPTDKYSGAACNEWISEGRIICCEMISDDGMSYSCAHCGRLPNEKLSKKDFEAAMIKGFGIYPNQASGGSK